MSTPSGSVAVGEAHPADRVDRITPDDLTTLVTDVGPAPMQVGAVLTLEVGPDFDVLEAIATLGERIRTVPRLRQRLVAAPPACGRPIWVDDGAFDLRRHVRVRRCPDPGDGGALLDLAAALVATPLPRDRSPWSAVFVTDVAPGRMGLVISFHHVMADGIGGLAVLANLVDGVSAADAVAAFPRSRPTSRALAVDAARSRAAWVRELAAHGRQLRAALGELRGAGTSRPVRCSLNRPTGPRRRLAVVRRELAPVLDAAHDHGATVNDVVLTAVTGALADLLGHRGESVARLVVSVPVTRRRSTGAADLGNQVGVMPVELPAVGPDGERLRQVADVTRRAKQAPSGAAAGVVGPLFRTLARARLFRWFIGHQRLVHTFVTNLRGPEERLRFLGAPITEVVPITIVPGNVTVSFAVLSYAGDLIVAVIADPDACPDLGVLTDSLDERLARLT